MSTRQIIDGYTNAWTSGDLRATRKFLADDLDFQGSMETHSTAGGFMRGLGMFHEQVYASHTKLHQITEGDSGIVLYDCALKTGVNLRCAEYFKVRNGKISQIRLVFDRGKLPNP